jgi:hypothetical protein
MNAGDYGKNEAFWKARETSALASIRSVLGFPLVAGDPSEVTDEQDIDGHKLTHHTLRNVSVYFLRLPDGDVDGKGYASTSHQTMIKLYKQDISNLKTIDNANTYTLDGLYTLTSALIKKEATKSSSYFYIQDPGSEKNFSHSDHLITQFIARTAISKSGLKTCKVRAFSDYRIKNKTMNLSKAEMTKKTQLFSAYDVVMMMLQNECGFCAVSHYEWLSRSYMREFNC